VFVLCVLFLVLCSLFVVSQVGQIVNPSEWWKGTGSLSRQTSGQFQFDSRTLASPATLCFVSCQRRQFGIRSDGRQELGSAHVGQAASLPFLLKLAA
jgi:hypothetical protein